jgi:hypothetical protein
MCVSILNAAKPVVRFRATVRACAPRQTVVVADSFDSWLGAFESGISSDGGVMLRRIFDEHGPVQPDEAARLGREYQVELARAAVLLIDHDVAATTDLEPPPFQCDEDDGPPRVSYWSQPASSPVMGLTAVAVTVEVADFMQAEVMEDLHSPWPFCSKHGAGLHPVAVANQPVWTCGSGDHVVARIGELERTVTR